MCYYGIINLLWCKRSSSQHHRLHTEEDRVIGAERVVKIFKGRVINYVFFEVTEQKFLECLKKIMR